MKLYHGSHAGALQNMQRIGIAPRAVSKGRNNETSAQAMSELDQLTFGHGQIHRSSCSERVRSHSTTSATR
jgi:hypothetical protein